MASWLYTLIRDFDFDSHFDSGCVCVLETTQEVEWEGREGGEREKVQYNNSKAQTILIANFGSHTQIQAQTLLSKPLDKLTNATTTTVATTTLVAVYGLPHYTARSPCATSSSSSFLTAFAMADLPLLLPPIEIAVVALALVSALALVLAAV